MSKNLTRKGLALGAVAALASTLFAGAPAQAAGETITLTSSVGTSFKTLLGGSFELSSVFSGFTVAPSNLKYLVTGVAAGDLTAYSDTKVTRSASGDFNSQTSNIHDNSTNAVETKQTSLAVPGEYLAASTSQVKLGLTGIAATTKITVTAFLDNVNADNVISSGEVKSSPVDITFVKLSEVTASVVAVAPKIGAAQTLTANVTLGDINLQQAESSDLTTVIFQQNGSGSSSQATTWSADDAALVATSPSFTVADGNVFTAQAYLNGVKSGSAVVATPVAGATVITLTDARPVTTLSENIAADGADDYFVRVGATSFTATSSAQYTDADGVVDQAVGAGLKAKVTISEAGLTSANASVTAGGKTVTTASTADKTFDAVTDADGNVVIPVTTSGMKDGDYVNITVSYLSTTAWTATTNTVTKYTYQNAAVSKVRLVNAGDALVAVKKNGTYSVAYKLVDQFGGAISTATATDSVKRQLKVSASGTGHTFAKQYDFVNGIATVSITDDGTTDGTSYTVTTALEGLKSGSTTVFADNVDASHNPADFDVYVGVASAGYLSLDTLSTDKKPLAYDKFVSVNTDLDPVPTAATNETASKHTFSGTVLNTDGTVGAGLPVVISGTGLQFNKGTVWATDKITVIATSTGTFTVDVYSHKSGSQTITATAGSVTKTGKLAWAVAPENKGSVIAITAPQYVGVGTVNISVLLTDKWGNAVATTQGVTRENTFSVAVSGTAGISGTIPAETDANGLVKFYQLIATNDTGSFTVTVKYDADGAGTESAQITKTATVTIGKAPVAGATAAIAGSTKRFFVSVSGNTAAKNVVVKVAGKTVATLKGAAAKKTYTVKATKGSKKVTVYVGGKLIATKTVTVK